MRARLAASLALGLLWASTCVAQPWAIATADDSEATRRIADDLRQRLARIEHLPGPVTIAIGPAALRDVSHRITDGVVISAYTSSQVWQSLVPRWPRASFTALYADPAPADQLELVRLLYKRPVNVVALTSGRPGRLAALLPGVDVQAFGDGDDINRTLERIAHAEVLLAWPDGAVFNNANVRNILLSAYRNGQGVIGFSADMVRTGALATTWSGVEDINVQLVEMVDAYARTGRVPHPQFPRYFRTAVNEGLARSLRVPVDDDARRFARRPAGGTP